MFSENISNYTMRQPKSEWDEATGESYTGQKKLYVSRLFTGSHLEIEMYRFKISKYRIGVFATNSELQFMFAT